MLTNIRSNFNDKAWGLIGIAISICWALSLLGKNANLGIVSYLCILLVAVLCGPWAGALTGLLGVPVANAFWYFLYPNSQDYSGGTLLVWCLFYMFIGYFAGRMAQWGYFKFWWTSILAGFISALSSIILLIALSAVGMDLNDFSFLVSITNFIAPLTFSALIVFLLVQSPLKRYIVGLPRADYVLPTTNMDGSGTSMQAGPTSGQKAAGLMVIVLIIFSILFVLWLAYEISAATSSL